MDVSRDHADEGADYDVRRIGRDPRAMEAFYLEHLAVVRQFVTRRTYDPHTAADLISATFLSAMNSAHRYSADKGTPSAWLLGVAFRTVRAEERRSARHWRATHRAGGRRELADDAIDALEKQIDAQRAHSATLSALRALPRVDQALLELTALEELSVADAARVLGLTPGAARVRLHRARQRLQNVHTPNDATVAVPAPIQGT